MEEGTRVAVELMNAVQRQGHQVFVHPKSLAELGGDQNAERRELRAILVRKYPVLPAPPRTGSEITDALGAPRPGSNDEVDFELLAAVHANAVDYFVTDDTRLRKRAEKVGLSRRVLSPSDALATLRALLPIEIRPPPAVEEVFAHELRADDPIFASLRQDYRGFDAWLEKCKRDQRKAWRIMSGASIAALAIIKHETGPEFGLDGPLLKLCTFKVSPDFRGFRFGELMLKTVFDYAFANQLRAIYVTVFDRHEELISLLEQFGFERIPASTAAGEGVMAKSLHPKEGDWTSLDELAFHVKFGPRHVKVADAFFVPIRDHYHSKLFPELAEQRSLFMGREAFGNSILKAYLCHANTRRLKAGSVVLFYHSGGTEAVDAIGVVEEVLVTSDPAELVRFVGKRTVYSIEEMRAMCEGEVLALLFRQATSLAAPIGLSSLREHGALVGHPQSIVRVREAGKEWIRAQVERH